MFPEFQEEQIEPKSPLIKNLVEKINTKGFRFHPGKICEHINKEVERQFAELCAEAFKGAAISKLEDAQHETFEWLQKEDARYSQWKQDKAAAEAILNHPPQAVKELSAQLPQPTESQLDNVSSIQKKKKK